MEDSLVSLEEVKCLLDAGQQGVDALAPMVTLLLSKEEGGIFIPLFMANATYHTSFPYLCEQIDMDGASGLCRLHSSTPSHSSDTTASSQTGVGRDSAGNSRGSSHCGLGPDSGSVEVQCDPHKVLQVLSSHASMWADNKMSVHLIIGSNSGDGGAGTWRCCLESATRGLIKRLQLCGLMDEVGVKKSVLWEE